MKKVILTLLMLSVMSHAATTVFETDSISPGDINALEDSINSGDTLLIQAIGDTLWMESGVEFSVDGATIILDADADGSGYGVFLKNIEDTLLLSGMDMTLSVRYSDTAGYYSDSMLVLVDEVSKNFVSSIDTIVATGNGTDTTYDTTYNTAFYRQMMVDTILSNNNTIEFLQYIDEVGDFDSLNVALSSANGPQKNGLGQGIVLAPGTYSFLGKSVTHFVIGDTSSNHISAMQSFAFQGVFEGNGQTIESLNINNPGGTFNESGFIRNIYQATVRNLIVSISVGSATQYTAGLTAISAASEISNVAVQGGAINTANAAGAAKLGGIVASSTNDILTGLSNTNTIQSKAASVNAEVGGIVGMANQLTISESENSGEILAQGTGTVAGGIAGAITTLAVPAFNLKNTAAVSATVSGATPEALGGVFGKLDNNSTRVNNVVNTGTVGSSSYPADQSGGLVAWGNNVIIEESQNYGDVSGEEAGGIAGLLQSTGNRIKKVQNYGAVTATTVAGGVVATIEKGEVSYCSNNGAVIATNVNSQTGGIIGFGENLLVENVLNTGSVEGDEHSGGIFGYIALSRVLNLFNSGDVTGDSLFGGIVARPVLGPTKEISYGISVGAIIKNGSDTARAGGVSDNNSSYLNECYYDADVFTAPTSSATYFFSSAGMQASSTLINPVASIFGLWDSDSWIFGDSVLLYPGLKGLRETNDIPFQKLLKSVYAKEDTDDITLNLYQTLPIFSEGWTYDAESLDSGFTLTLTGSDLLLEQNYNFNSTDTIVISATHGESQVVISDTLFIAVNEPMNTVPQHKIEFEEIVLIKDASGVNFYLDSLYEDIDSDSLVMTAVSKLKDSAIVLSTDNKTYFRLSPFGVTGFDTLIINVTDFPDGNTITDTVLVYVKSSPVAENDPILSTTLLHGFGSLAVYLGDAFSDEDGDSLIYTAEVASGLCSLNVVGDTLYIIDNDSIGEDEIIVTATDPWNLSATSSIDLVIKSIPVAQDSIADTLILASDSIAYDILGFFLDADGDAITLSVSADSGLSAKIDRDYLILEGDGSSIGDKEVTLTATDEDSNAVDYSFTVTLNLAPSFPKELSEINVLGLTTLDLSEYFSDADLIIYSVEGEDESCISTVIDESTLILRGSVSATEECSNTVSIVATDAANYSSSQDLVINLKFSEPDTSDSAGTNIEYTGNATALELSQANDILIVNNLQSGKMMNYAIYNMQGVVEMQGTQRAMSTSLEINLTELNSGVHYIVVKQNSSILNAKLVR